jgi:hypothetical protein
MRSSVFSIESKPSSKGLENGVIRVIGAVLDKSDLKAKPVFDSISPLPNDMVDRITEFKRGPDSGREKVGNDA